MTYVLFISSGVDVSFNPEYDFTDQESKIETRHRTKSGREYVYKWGDYKKFKFSVSYVNSSFKSIVNSWWNTNTELLFMKQGETQVYSVRLGGKKSPIGKFIKPYDDNFKGTIDLGTY